MVQPMAIYDEIGVRPFINAGGWMYTRYGGTIMPEAVVAAMVEASRHFVTIFDLQNRVGEAIAKMTQNEETESPCVRLNCRMAKKRSWPAVSGEFLQKDELLA